MRYCFLLFLLLMGTTVLAQHQPTTLVVRAKAKDAKFIGSSIGGAYVLIKDAHSGMVLAEGLTTGTTGNTARIMQEAHQRNRPLADEQTAKFVAELPLEKPQFVTVEVWAPYNQPGARVQAQTQLWLIPGKHITGDGLVLEIPGLVVNALQPQTHETVKSGTRLPIKANVVLTCGCPISPGGVWDANQYEVEALVYSAGKLLQKIPLRVKEKTSTFEADFQPVATGLYEFIITAYDSTSGNTGVDKVNIIVE